MHSTVFFMVQNCIQKIKQTARYTEHIDILNVAEKWRNLTQEEVA